MNAAPETTRAAASADTALPVAAAASGPGLRANAVRGGAITVAAQACKFVLSLTSTILLARLLQPADYGLVAMVTGFTGLLEILKDGGLSLATVQRAQVTHAEISTLFWLNLAFGTGLMLVTLLLAPFVVYFYAEPRLTGIAVALGFTFVIAALGVQHLALLRRNLQFARLAAIEVSALLAGLAAAILLAVRGGAHWALVGMTVVSTLTATAAAWLIIPWRPGRHFSLGAVRPMLAFGGNLLATRVVYHFVHGLPSVLLGWQWGPAAVGIYHRAYTLLLFAIDQVIGPVALVVMPHLSRLQDEPERLARNFLAAYRLVVSALVPIMATCAVFSAEIVALLLGPQWHETAAVFRWLALGGILVAMLNAQGFVLLATGRARDCVRVGLLDASAITVAYLAGLRFGPVGVAAGYCISKLLLCVPLTARSIRDTPVTWSDLLAVVRPPLAATALAAGAGLAFKVAAAAVLRPPHLALAGSALMLGLYAVILLFGARHWIFYRDLATELLPRRPGVGTP